MKRIITLLMLLAFATTSIEIYALNTVKTVSQVNSSVTLSEAVDYTITSSTPFLTNGSIDITNEEAAVIFSSLKPSKVKSTYLQYITVNGEAAVHDDNVRVAIHENGTIVYGHGHSKFHPLTVYTEENFGGELRNTFVPKTIYSSLGSFDNAIRSFKLKRGYMVTLATSKNGKGYSRVFIAQDDDLEVGDIGKYLSGKVSFVRILAWNKVTKKGSAGGGEDQMDALNITWFYNWNAGDLNFDDYEYVQHHHHEGWPSYDVIAASSNSNTVLGNNEPDNHADKREQYITPEEMEERMFSSGSWSNIYRSGMRVGSPAVSGNVTGWLVPFMDLCKKYNYRIDFVAVHGYWYAWGGSYDSSLNWYFSLFNRPVWLTEFNYGANWTSWASDDHSASDENQKIELAALSDIVNHLEANDHVERYAIYNWVEDCRAVFLNGKLTLAGEWYANLKSNTAYTGNYEVIPGWVYNAPTDLEVEYSNVNQTASFSWRNINTEQTDSTYIERLDPDANEYVAIAKLSSSELEDMTYKSDTLEGLSGYFLYRIHNFDSDGRERYSDEVSISIASCAGDSTIQYGTLSADNFNAISTDFTMEFGDIPALFMSIPTNRNNKVGLGKLVTSVKKNGFTFSYLPWQSSGNQTMASADKVSFMALPYGISHYEDPTTGKDIQIIVGSTKVSGDTLEVTFDEAFPEGVVPVVITELRPSLKSSPIMTKVWDISNTGFRCRVAYEEGKSTNIRARQNMNFMAMTPGQANLGNGLILSAGRSDQKLYGSLARSLYFNTEDQEGNADTLRLTNPIIFGNIQESVIPSFALLRYTRDVTKEYENEDGSVTTYSVGAMIKRQVDGSASDMGRTTDSGETFGWITLSEDKEYVAPDPTGISQIVYNSSGSTFNVSSTNRIIQVEGADNYDVYSMDGTRVAANATQTPGVYIVRVGKNAKKVIVR